MQRVSEQSKQETKAPIAANNLPFFPAGVLPLAGLALAKPLAEPSAAAKRPPIELASARGADVGVDDCEAPCGVPVW